MSTRRLPFALSALAIALLAIHGPALAAEEVSVEELTKPESWVSIGLGGLFGDDRRQLGIVGGLRDTGGYLLLDADINRRDDATGTWQTLQATNVGMDSREIRAEYAKQGHHGVAVEYRQSLRDVPYLVNTGVTGIGTTTQLVPTRCTSPGVPVGCYEVGSGADLQLGTERIQYGLDFFKYLTPNLKFRVTGSNEDKDGNRHWRVGGQPEFAVMPIDWNVRKIEAALDYVGEHLQMAGGYNGSWFKNDNDMLTAIRAGVPYYLSMPLDSEAHQVFLDGGYSFSPTTRGSFKLYYTHATQDEHLPTADIPLLSLPDGPTSLDGEVNTTLVQVGITSRPIPRLNLVADLRYHNVDDQTPVQLFINTVSTSTTTGITTHTEVHNTPLSYETLTGKLEGSYNVANGYNLIAGVDHSAQDRTVPLIIKPEDTATDVWTDERYVPFRAELDETTYRIQLRKSLSETLNGSLAYLYSNRDGSEYSEAHHSIGGINPVNIADRERNKWRVMLDWSPMSRLGLQFNFENSEDDYGPDTNPYGLRDGSAQLFAIDADYSISDKWRLTAWASHDTTKASQFNGRWDRFTEVLEVERDSKLKDTGDSVGLGIRGQATPKLKVGADLQWTRTTSEYNDTIISYDDGDTDPTDTGYPLGVSPLQDITNTLTKISLYAEYALKKNADLRFDVIHERWKTDDWSWQFSDGSPFVFNDGTMVITYPKQNSTFVGMRYKYTF